MFFSLNGEPFSHIFPSQLFPSLANSKQRSYIRMEHGNYHLLSWVGALARSYLPSVAGEWWLVAGGTLGWLAHRRQGRLLLQRENQSGIFHISIFIFDTTKLKSLFHCSFASSRHCINKLLYDWESGLIWLVDRHTKRAAKGEWSAVQLSRRTKKEREANTMLMRADARHKAVAMRGLWHRSCRRLWQVQILSSQCTVSIKFFFVWVYNQVNWKSFLKA